MLINGDRLLNTPVLSLQTGSELARTESPVIDPATLKIIAFEVDGQLLQTKPSLLRIEDIREISDIGLIIDSIDELASPNDIIKLGEIYSLNFMPIGMNVIDERKHKLGKVNGFTVDTMSFIIEQLSVKRPFFKSLNDTELLIHRQQIVEINNQAIIIHSETEMPELTMESISNSYINPFRKQPMPDQPENTA